MGVAIVLRVTLQLTLATNQLLDIWAIYSNRVIVPKLSLEARRRLDQARVAAWMEPSRSQPSIAGSKIRLRYSAQKCVGVFPSPHLIPRPCHTHAMLHMVYGRVE